MATRLPCLSFGPWAPLFQALLLQDSALPERPLPLAGCTVEAHISSAKRLCCRIEFCTSGHDDQGLPYELHALEVPLATTVRLFESEALQLEKLLLPSLERLSARVSRV